MAKCEHRKGYDNATCILCEMDRRKKIIEQLQAENYRLRDLQGEYLIEAIGEKKAEFA